MGYVFEELICKFNEENNEEAGEHFTPREVIELMNVTGATVQNSFA
jgi:type I restriction enzyme M protein